MKVTVKSHALWLFVGVATCTLLALFCLCRNDWLIDAVTHDQNQRAKLLILLGADANARQDDDSRWTVLHVAADVGNVEMVRFLVRHGADVDAKAGIQVTPRAAAQMNHQTEVERVLVGFGAKPVPKDLHVP